MRNYNKINNLVGMACLYHCSRDILHDHRADCQLLDCPEFITTGYKLEVDTPPAHLSLC